MAKSVKRNTTNRASYPTDVTLGTVYTGPGDTWASLSKASGLSRNELVALNPHVSAVEEIEAGIPIDLPVVARARIIENTRQRARTSPYEVAKDELELGICENDRPGQDHPRIRLYHSTTTGGAMPDEIAWCSSFVNYCVEQAGMAGTNSKAARSWLEWGRSVSAGNWQEGDIVVFWRESVNSWKGHVGFLVRWNGSRPYVLGGNQGNCLNIDDPYGFNRILSVRRA